MRIEYPASSNLHLSFKFSTDLKKLIREKYYEVECYPIFIRFFHMEEIIKEVNDKSISGIKEYLSKYNYSKYSTKLAPYSRTTKFKEIQFDILLNHYKHINVKSR